MIILPVGNPAEAAIVADIDLAVGAERRAVRAARDLRHHFLAPVGIDPGQPLAADFDQHHRTVRHDDRTFRKLQIGGENADIGHYILPASLAAGGLLMVPHAQRCCSSRYGKVNLACQASGPQRLPGVAGRKAPHLRCRRPGDAIEPVIPRSREASSESRRRIDMAASARGHRVSECAPDIRRRSSG